jgi:glutamine phosphoribosylpyrophosphate amidotransferase
MCGIVGSFDLSKIELGFEHIKNRGTKSYSLSVATLGGKLLYMKAYELANVGIQDALKDLCSVEHSSEDVLYYILHAQSPTGTVSSPHPAKASGAEIYLWHNGMLNSTAYRSASEAAWDTQILADNIADKGLADALNRFEGSFACIMLSKDGVFLFRNAIAPLYYSAQGTVSSVAAFEGATRLDSNKIFQLHQNDSVISVDVTASFSNRHNPFGV